jgi:Family of unknown function (DUF5989)
MLEFIKEFWLFLRERKKYWLAPIIVALALGGSLWYSLKALRLRLLSIRSSR